MSGVIVPCICMIQTVATLSTMEAEYTSHCMLRKVYWIKMATEEDWTLFDEAHINKGMREAW